MKKIKHIPTIKILKKCGGRNGHDLINLKNHLLGTYFSIHNIPALKDDFLFLTEDKDLDRLINLLSEFGKYSRYYNLDIITSATKQSKDIESMWKEYETFILTSNPQLLKDIEDVKHQKEVIKTILKVILILLERFVRAITRQMTLGKLGSKAKQFSSICYPFIMLKDVDLGNQDYK